MIKRVDIGLWLELIVINRVIVVVVYNWCIINYMKVNSPSPALSRQIAKRLTTKVKAILKLKANKHKKINNKHHP